MDKYIKYAEENGQRLGQFISNAISRYLIDHNRGADDYDVGNALFFMDDKDLDIACGRYIEWLRVQGMGFRQPPQQLPVPDTIVRQLAPVKTRRVAAPKKKH